MATAETSVDSKLHPRPRQGHRKPVSDKRFSSYLQFGQTGTLCLVIFLAVYLVFIAGLFPLLSQEAPETTPTHRGEVLAPVVHHAVDSVKQHMHQVPGQQIANEVAVVIKKRIADFRKDQGVSDELLMKKASEEFNLLRKRKEGAKDSSGHGVDTAAMIAPGKRSGFMVLGMHRSGTSMLSGLMVIGLGYNVGSPLIGGAFDNEKGFFELIPVVLQNDEFMAKQKIWWAANVINYDANKALEDKKNSIVNFEEHGTAALKFLNDPSNAPYLQKDPRMCITLKTWLPLLNNEPAIVFTYRHPLEVAFSLMKREKNFSLEHGLRLWIIYNMRAIQNSADLCRVTSSNEAILANPLTEVQRISDELTSRCGVPAAPRKLVQEDVDKFVDPNLQHNKKQREAEDASKEVIADYDGCKVRDYKSDAKKKDLERERKVYLTAMKIYCDLASGKAYDNDYQWPDLK